MIKASLKKYPCFWISALLAALVLLYTLLPLRFYAEDAHYFWGLAKYFAAGQVAPDLYDPHYPKLFAMFWGSVLKVFPNLNFKAALALNLWLALSAGLTLFKRIEKKHSLFFFAAAYSGFLLTEYLLGEVFVPQLWGFVLLPLIPLCLFSKNKKLALPAFLLLYLVHSGSAYMAILASAPLVLFKETRSKVLPLALLLSPLLLWKGLHLVLLLGGLPLEQLPLNELSGILQSKANLPSAVWQQSSLQIFLLSGVPLALLLPLGFLWQKKQPSPLALWGFSLAGLCLFAYIFYQDWISLIPLQWTRDRYLGPAFLGLMLALPELWPKLKYKKILSFGLGIFIVFQGGLALYRETRFDPHIEDSKKQLQVIHSKISTDERLMVLWPSGPSGLIFEEFSPQPTYYFYPDPLRPEYHLNKRALNLGGYYEELTLEETKERFQAWGIEWVLVEASLSGMTHSIAQWAEEEFYFEDQELYLMRLPRP